MTYINRIDEVAKRFGFIQPFLVRAMGIWENLERDAKLLGYDILSHHLREEHYHTEEAELGTSLRTNIRAMIMILYEQEGATPHADCEQLREKDAIYGGSWCKRGGQGAFMMLARKADRVAEFMKNGASAIHADNEDTLGDLRRYLILVESWHVDQEKPLVQRGEEMLVSVLSPPPSAKAAVRYCVDAKQNGHCDRCGQMMVYPDGSREQSLQVCELPF